MKINLEHDIKILGTPLLILISICLLFAISAKIILDRVTSLQTQLGDNQKNENTLQTKLNSLQSQSSNPSVSIDSQAAVAALPDTSALLPAITQVQNGALSFGLALSNLRSSDITAASGSSVFLVQMEFNADGNYFSISSFIEKMVNSTPINRFDSIKIVNQNAAGNVLYRLSVTLLSYWAPLPTKLPNIEEPLKELTPDEQKIISQVLSLQQPIFIQIGTSSASPTGPTGRADPFSL